MDHSECAHPRTPSERKKCRDAHGIIPSPVPKRPDIRRNPDDDRHGTLAGWVAGCRCDACKGVKNAQARANRRRRAYEHWVSVYAVRGR